MAALSYISEKFGKLHFNFELIWENQSVPDDLIIELDKIAMSVHLSLISPNSRYGNVSVFAKKNATRTKEWYYIAHTIWGVFISNYFIKKTTKVNFVVLIYFKNCLANISRFYSLNNSSCNLVWISV